MYINTSAHNARFGVAAIATHTDTRHNVMVCGCVLGVCGFLEQRMLCCCTIRQIDKAIFACALNYISHAEHVCTFSHNRTGARGIPPAGFA